MTSFVSLILAIVALGGCGSVPSQARETPMVMSQYKGWTIGITPSQTGSQSWRARVQAWPGVVNPQNHGGVALHFAQSASSESAIVESAIRVAREYIDASRIDRDAVIDPASQPRPGSTVMSEHNGWTMRITPSGASASDGRVWHAGVEVWPPGGNPGTHGGIQVRFTEVASDEKSIVESAIQSARRYIDASRARHQ